MATTTTVHGSNLLALPLAGGVGRQPSLEDQAFGAPSPPPVQGIGDGETMPRHTLHTRSNHHTRRSAAHPLYQHPPTKGDDLDNDTGYGLSPSSLQPRVAACSWMSSVTAPAVAGTALTLVVLYSLSKAIEYTEVFQSNQQHRMALYGLNAVAILITVAVVAYVARHGRG